MADAVLNVTGYIDSYDYYDSTSLANLRDSLLLQAPFESVTVYINSGGGSVTEGLAIHDFLRNLNVPVTTIVMGICYSIAGPIWMAGSTRLISEYSDAMIHPVSGWAEGTSEEIRAYADLMDVYGDKIINLYVDRCNMTADEVRAMMDATTYLDSAKCIELGLATGIYSQATARADVRRQMVNHANRKPVATPPVPIPSQSNSNKPAMAKQETTLEKAARDLQRFVNKLTGKPVNLDLSLADGTTVYVDSSADTPAVDDKVYTDSTMANAVADDTYSLADGSSITTVAGVITAVTAVPTDDITDSEEVKNLKAEIATLKAAATTAEATTNTKIAALENMVAGVVLNVNAVLGTQHSKDLDLNGKSGNGIKPIGNTEEAKPSANEDFESRRKPKS